MTRADFWPTLYAAKKMVRDAVPDTAVTDDKTAKAMADAVDALCKAMLMAKANVDA
jgi:hypothetical protein